MTDYGGALATPIDNLSDVDAVPAMGGSESADWTRNQTRRVFRVPLGREFVTIETGETDLPDWLERAISELNRIASLKENWDSYGARIVPQRTIEHALATLMRLMRPGVPFPSIHPTPSGAISFGWHARGRDLEVTVERPFVVTGYYADDDNPDQEWDGAVGLDLEEIADRISVIGR